MSLLTSLQPSLGPSPGSEQVLQAEPPTPLSAPLSPAHICFPSFLAPTPTRLLASPVGLAPLGALPGMAEAAEGGW